MKLNNIWGYGQLFAFSGIDGQARYHDELVCTLTSRPLEIRMELRSWVKITFPVEGKIDFHAITGDMIDAATEKGDFFITFCDSDTLIGYAPVPPEITTETEWETLRSFGVDIWYSGHGAVSVKTEVLANGLYKFAIAYSQYWYTLGRARVREAIGDDVAALKEARYAYYRDMPECKNKKYEMLYYKALSVNKVNVHSPEGKVPCRWTTPDRVPHRRFWLWDSVFHALAIVTYNHGLAEDCIRSVLSQQREDGFVPADMTPYARVDVTQPQVLSFGTWEVYKKTGNRAFLEECAPKLDAYLTWDKTNRDENKNGLLEWCVEPEDVNCKSGESGWDNSPRFEFGTDMDTCDFTAFQIHDAEYLVKIYEELGNVERAAFWQDECERLRTAINELLWDEEDGVYYDRLFGGELTKVLAPSSFFPMFAGVPSAEQAERMVKVLTDPELLWTPVPLPTVAKNCEMYGTDMWRGGTWLNINYFVIRGLRRYGYVELAEELKRRTLETVNEWYEKTGVIYEFYDSQGKVPPYLCERKGKPIDPPDWRKFLHSISDFNWSSCFTLLFIQDELYC